MKVSELQAPRVDFGHAGDCVYVCAPFLNATHEEKLAVAIVRRKIFDRGLIPVWAPSLLEGLGIREDLPSERERALKVALALLGHCRSLVLVGAPSPKGRPGAPFARITDGMRRELRAWLPNDLTYASDLETPVPVLEWLRASNAPPFASFEEVLLRLEDDLRAGKGWPVREVTP